MRNHPRKRGLIMTASVAIAPLVAGCITDPMASSTYNATDLSYNASFRPHVADFDVELSAAGTFKPGEAFTVTARVGADLDVPDVTLRLTALDLPASNNPAGHSRFTTFATWRGTATTNTHEIVSKQFTFPEPGYYRIVAAVAAQKPASQMTSLHADYPEGTTKTLWLVIHPDGGRLTDEYEEQPQDSLRLLFGAYGPYRRPTPHANQQQQPNPDVSGPSASQYADPYYIWGYYEYFDESTETNYYVNDYVPAAGGYVNATCVGYSSSEVLIPDVEEQVITSVNTDGEFNVWCPTEAAYAWDHVEGMIYSRNVGIVDVRNSTGSANGSAFYGWDTDTVTAYAASNRQGHVLTVLSARVPQSSSAFNRSRSEIEARVWESGSDPGGYLPSPDRIEYRRSTTMFNDDGPPMFMHEYGHAFHWKAIEEPDTTGGGICPGHSPPDSTSLSCALIEGFAEMYATFLLADFMTSGNWNHDYNMEINAYNDEGDGSIIEGAVAGFLFDLVDDADTPDSLAGDDDDASYSLEALGDILASCDMPSKSKIDGIDRFVYCAEETLAMQDSTNPGTSDYWFASRRPTTFSSFSVTSQGMDSLVVRRTWKYNLFNQGSLK